MTDSFVHLHVHSEYSMLDGAARVKPLMAEAVKLGMPAIAITDHGNMFGAYDFWKTANEHGIKPIIGTEAYITPGTRRDERIRVRWGDGGEDDVSGGGAYTHMTMLSVDNEGMHNLFKLSSLASIEGQYFKPRMDDELLSRYAKGIIATTGCPSGEVQTRLRLGQYDKAREAAARYQDIFGKENYFCEIMDHGLGIQKRVSSDLLKISKDLQIPLLATNDLHYTHQHDAEAHSALLCVGTGTTLNDPNRFKFDGQEFYLKSAAQMRQIFKDHPEACDNTLLIAERAAIGFEKRDLMPRFPVPEGETEASWFEKEVLRGISELFPEGVPERHQAQAHYEIEVINRMGFPGYFLVVADFISWARAQGIRVGPGRGSAAGAVVAWALGITGLDPLKHGLLFERFLNPDRVSMPDIDIDFDDRRRAEVIRYVTEKYGDDRVAQIITYGTIKAKQALKDSARVLGKPYAVGEKLTKAVPPPAKGKEPTLSDITVKSDHEDSRYREGAEFRELLDSDPDAKEVFELAKGLEHLKRQWGVHAAGVIMSAEPLIDVLPLLKREDDGAIITQFDQPPLESLGLLKMDFLGLRNLTVIEDTLQMIEANTGQKLDLESLDLDADQKTYDLLSNGDTLGVFQLDGNQMRSLLRQLRPTGFEDISAVLALYRPGPMGVNSHINYALRKNGLQTIDPIHPDLAEPLADILDSTYGLIVYQEQVMAVAQKLANFTLGQADILRKAMGKKNKQELDKQFEAFQAGMRGNGYRDDAINTLWEILVPFADYAFNKSHTAAYGVLSYWTAYLKANYPAEYMAALMTSVGDSKDKLAIYLNECRRMGIQVLPPDLNVSFGNFTAKDGDIRFGIGAVRNVGHHVVSAVVAAREQDGPFSSFADFLKRIPAQALNKRTVESLIKAGAFDGLGSNRRSLVEIHEMKIDAALAKKKREAHGEIDLFEGFFDEEDEADELPSHPEWPKKDKLAFEREMLGLYVSDHPLIGLEPLLARNADLSIADLIDPDRDLEGKVISLAGLITGVSHRIAKQSGKGYGTITLEDFTGDLSITVLGNTYTSFASLMVSDTIVAIRGRVTKRDDEIGLHAQNIQRLETDGFDTNTPVTIQMPEEWATRQTAEKIQQILKRNQGESQVRLKLLGRSGEKAYELPFLVSHSTPLYSELKALLGENCIL